MQIGSYSQAATLKAARDKASRAGVPVYTRELAIDGGKTVTRLRAGPFKTRAEADRAASRLKGAGLTASVQQV